MQQKKTKKPSSPYLCFGVPKVTNPSYGVLQLQGLE